MAKQTHLYQNRLGIYYLRLRDESGDRKISLQTRDLNSAKIALSLSQFEQSTMLIDPKKIKAWTLKKSADGSVEISTENNDSDRASAIRAVELMAQSLPTREELHTSKKLNTITLGGAVAEYKIFLSKSTIAVKSQKMAHTTLADLIKNLGTDFLMSEINDDVIEDEWLIPRCALVAATTAKRDLSFIRSFIGWAADRKRKYCPAALSLNFKAQGENWKYLDKSDLQLIFNNLPKNATEAWQLWVPILGLYTGARISDLGNLETGNFSVKNGIDALFINGSKTDASVRTIPLHPDLIQLGLLDLVKKRNNKKMLFDIRVNSDNGRGGTASKWFTRYKREIGLNDELKVFHSFRPTIVDRMKQHGAQFEARCQYVGHDSGGGVHNKIYGRNELSLSLIKSEVVDKIDWLKYCGFELDFEALQSKAKEFT